MGKIMSIIIWNYVHNYLAAICTEKRERLSIAQRFFAAVEIAGVARVAVVPAAVGFCGSSGDVAGCRCVCAGRLLTTLPFLSYPYLQTKWIQNKWLGWAGLGWMDACGVAAGSVDE
jgi:hypothetical protein